MRGQGRVTIEKLREAWSSADLAERTIKEAEALIQHGNVATALPLLVAAANKANESKAAIEAAAKAS